ncbi:MAG: ribonuclease R [Alphaproteobacteria bacterium]|nr:ribonuclease R [Alphaproteobacteria bacterium]
MKHPTVSFTKADIFEFIKSQLLPPTRRNIARAFNIKDQTRILLKTILKELEQEDLIKRSSGTYQLTESPQFVDVEITAISAEGEFIGSPVDWPSDKPHPKIYILAPRLHKGHSHVNIEIGVHVRVRLEWIDSHTCEGRVIRVFEKLEAQQLVGRFEKTERGGWLIPSDRKIREVFPVTPTSFTNVKNGDIVLAEIQGIGQGKAAQATIVKVIGSMDDPRSITLIAIHELGLPHEFSREAERLAATATLPPLSDREDLRSIPLITIDDEDARDFDDAVWAEPDQNPENPGGWHAIVGIADVAYYVRPQDALDQTAFERGNSVYFADRVIPMLPEALSNEMCSLKPNVERACLAVHLWFNSQGKLIRHHFVRGIMKSAARLTYTQVQNAYEGDTSHLSKDFTKTHIAPLYGVFKALTKARLKRGSLDLDLPERRIILDNKGNIQEIKLRTRFDSHRLIEELMIAANVAAAITLENKRQPCMYRIHDRPDPAKVFSLHNFLAGIEIKFKKSQQIEAQYLSDLCKQVSQTPFANIVNELILRTQAQAEYNPDNIGHFGLGLTNYCHFTSPIRRYSDILVHRALISGLKFGEGGLLAEDGSRFAEIGTHISATERRAAQAERITVDRFIALFMQGQIGQEFKCRISGVTNFGLFVTVDHSGATGLIPIRALPHDYYHFDEKHQWLLGRSRRLCFRLGDMVMVKLEKVEPVTGGLEFSMLKSLQQPSIRRRDKTNSAKRKKAKKS